MCQVISDHCGCKPSSAGVSAQGVVVTLGGLAAVSLAYTVLTVAWLPLMALWLAVAAIASRRVRRALLRLIRWLAREMWHTWTTRHERPAAATQALAPAELAWSVTLSAITPTGPAWLADGVVVGAWETAASCEAETIGRALLAYAERGQRPPGPLCCRAEPHVGLAR
jgi:hypothetical protein